MVLPAFVAHLARASSSLFLAVVISVRRLVNSSSGIATLAGEKSPADTTHLVRPPRVLKTDTIRSPFVR